MSKINRYKDPQKQLEYINKWAKDNYQMFAFRLHKIKDKELIDEIQNRKKSLTEFIRDLYLENKKRLP